MVDYSTEVEIAMFEQPSCVQLLENVRPQMIDQYDELLDKLAETYDDLRHIFMLAQRKSSKSQE